MTPQEWRELGILGRYVAYQNAVARLVAAKREIRYLRCYGNKDCTSMAEEAMERGELDRTADRENAP